MVPMTRRELLKILATSAASAALIPGCTPTNKEKTVPQNSDENSFSGNPILEATPLPKAGPWPTQDPFLFCVHHNDQYPAGNKQSGPAANLAGRSIGQDFANIDGWNMYHGETVPGFPKHPHRGFETVTVVQEGLIDHADSLGAAARYGNGDVQWLTAGNGINHAEMFPLLSQDAPNPVDFFQIWLNLPGQNKRVAPHFSMFWNKEIPVIHHQDASGRTTVVRLIAGTYDGGQALNPPPHSWAAQSDAHVAIWIIELEPGATWTLPSAHPQTLRALYLVDGNSLVLARQNFESKSRVSVHPEANILIQNGKSKNRLLLLQGRPIGEPVAQHGPFVMNTREEIIEAYNDYQATQFGGWPWEDKAPTHGANPERFARYADKRRETPS